MLLNLPLNVEDVCAARHAPCQSSKFQRCSQRGLLAKLARLHSWCGHPTMSNIVADTALSSACRHA